MGHMPSLSPLGWLRKEPPASFGGAAGAGFGAADCFAMMDNMGRDAGCVSG